jgi:hypothetical protein
MSEGLINTSNGIPANYSHLISVGPYNIPAGDSEVVAFAFVIGESLTEIRDQAYQAFWIYPGLTNVDDNRTNIPTDFSISQNYPNPFNSNTAIDIKSTSSTSLFIYDITGRLVRTIGVPTGGLTQIIWDGANQKGEKVSTGIYLYRLDNQPLSEVKKMMLLK